MAQADQTIQNASFSSVRTDINDNLAALFSQSSGNSAPAVTVAFQPWIDNSSSPAVWKVRNAANNGWITVGTIDATTFAVGGIAPIANGGTGQTTAAAALTALLPSQSGNNGKALISNGTAASWGTVAAGASIQAFTSSGTYTPTAGKTTFLVIVTGSGGGGGSDYGGAVGGGGGAGGTGLRLYSTTEMGSSATVTVGGEGAGTSNYYASATAGGSSSLAPTGSGSTLTGAGGGLGNNAYYSYPDTYLPGSPGGGGGMTNSLISINGNGGIGSTGGSSFFVSGHGRGGNAQANGNAGVVLILEW